MVPVTARIRHPKLKWAAVNRHWKGMAIRDKVEGERVIALTPYVASLLQGLPKASAWVFSTARSNAAKIGKGKPLKVDAGKPQASRKAGPIASPQKPHTGARKAAGIAGLTLHRLRRSFASLTEWLEVPAGVVAQIMGTSPVRPPRSTTRCGRPPSRSAGPSVEGAVD